MRKYQEEFGKLWDMNPLWSSLTPEQKAFIDTNSEIKKNKKTLSLDIIFDIIFMFNKWI